MVEGRQAHQRAAHTVTTGDEQVELTFYQPDSVFSCAATRSHAAAAQYPDDVPGLMESRRNLGSREYQREGDSEKHVHARFLSRECD